MRRLLIAAALLCAAGSSFADAEAKFGNDSIRVTQAPCSDAKVLQHITKLGQDGNDYRAASANVGGSSYAACWRPMLEQQVAVIVYDDGDQGLIPFKDLKPVKTI